MEVKLVRADAKELHAMQVKSFRELLEKYQDFDTSPANESVEKVEARLKQEFTYFYFICVGTQKAILLCEKMHGNKCWELDTILQEAQNCHLYEKMGYRQTGKTEVINERLTLVFYEKKG